MASPASFASAAGVEAYFKTATGQDFVTWFNAHHAKRGSWATNGSFRERAIVDTAAARQAFGHFCDNLPSIFGRPATLEEFLCLTSIVINESPSFMPVSELVGLDGHPGIAYAFDAIAGMKRSYNLAPLNRLAGNLFRDDTFLAAHGHRALAANVAHTTDPRWNGVAYPQFDFTTSTDPAQTGIILEADFYKFRGRGLIQTTFRSNYLPLISFVQTCTHPNAVLQEYRARWAGKTPNEAATISSNDDWNRLYMETECVVALEAIRQHSTGAGNYLAVSSDRSVLAGTGAGSAFKMGSAVSGSDAYGHLFTGRVLQVWDSLPAVLDMPMNVHSMSPDWWKSRTIPQSPATVNETMQASTDFGLPAGAQRVRFGVYLSAGTGYLRFFNADGSEAAPVG